jgi:hypothetical protein
MEKGALILHARLGHWKRCSNSPRTSRSYATWPSICRNSDFSSRSRSLILLATRPLRTPAAVGQRLQMSNECDILVL